MCWRVCVVAIVVMFVWVVVCVCLSGRRVVVLFVCILFEGDGGVSISIVLFLTYLVRHDVVRLPPVRP